MIAGAVARGASLPGVASGFGPLRFRLPRPRFLPGPPPARRDDVAATLTVRSVATTRTPRTAAGARPLGPRHVGAGQAFRHGARDGQRRHHVRRRRRAHRAHPAWRGLPCCGRPGWPNGRPPCPWPAPVPPPPPRRGPPCPCGRPVRLAMPLAEELADRRVAMRRQAMDAVAGLDRPRTRVARPSLRPGCVGRGKWRSGLALRSARPAIALSLALRTRALAVALPGLPVRPAAVPLALRRGPGRFHPGGDQHGADFLRRQLERLPALHARRHRHRAVARADQAAHREAERLEQPPHLAVAAFLDARCDTSDSSLRRRRPRASRPCPARPRARCRSSSDCCCSGVSVPITRTAYSRSTS